MSERLSRERLAVIKERTSQCAAKGRHACRKHGFADATDAACFECELLAHIAALEAENEQLRWALGTIAYDTSLSVPLGQEPEAHYRMMTGSCISTAANALAALDEEVGE